MEVKLIMHIGKTKDVTKDVTLGKTKAIRERRLRILELIHKNNQITAPKLLKSVGVTE